jgi:hypothetical protein
MIITNYPVFSIDVGGGATRAAIAYTESQMKFRPARRLCVQMARRGSKGRAPCGGY